jgi:hypothetical protein
VLGPLTRIPSMQLGIDGGDSAGDCDSGYSCAYARNISLGVGDSAPAQGHNPSVVYDQLFGGFDPEASAEEQARRKLYRTSVLDHVRDEANSLKLPRLGHDRPREARRVPDRGRRARAQDREARRARSATRSIGRANLPTSSPTCTS